MWFKLSLKQLNQPILISTLLENFLLASKKQNDLFTKNYIKLNGNPANPSDTISSSDIIEVFFDEENDTVEGTSLPDIIYEDDLILALNKKANMIIYDLNHLDKETVDMQVSHYYHLYNRQAKVRHLHRLDNDTTGVLLYASNPLSHSYFSEVWQDRVNKEYLAIVEGTLKKKQGTISFHIGKDRHRNNHYVTSKSGKEAITHYQVMQEGNGISLVKILLETGRTHQIRVHFLAIGHPLVGDSLYESNIPASRVMLHSSKITFPHPMNQTIIEVSSGLPEDMTSFLKKRGLI